MAEGGVSGSAQSSGSCLKIARRVGVATGEQPVPQCSNCIEVHALIERNAVECLRQHSRRRADHLVRQSERRQGAEVEQLAAAFGGDAYVPRAHVAVEQMPGVEQRERRRHVPEITACVPIRCRRDVRQVLPVEQLHRVERSAVDAVVVNANDARVREGRERVVLALEEHRRRLAAMLERRFSATFCPVVPSVATRISPMPPFVRRFWTRYRSATSDGREGSVGSVSVAAEDPSGDVASAVDCIGLHDESTVSAAGLTTDPLLS